MAERVETVARIGDHRVHLFQVVREHREDGSTREWVVVGIRDDEVRLASLDFEWDLTVPRAAFGTGRFEALVEEGVPVWGY